MLPILIGIFGLAESFEGHRFLRGTTLCEHPLEDLVHYLGYPAFYLVLPVVTAMRLGTWLRQRHDPAVANIQLRNLLNGAIRFLVILPLIWVLSDIVARTLSAFLPRWTAVRTFEGITVMSTLYVFFVVVYLIPLCLVCLAILWFLNRLKHQDSRRQSTAAPTASMQFRYLVIPLSLGSLAFWFLLCLIAIPLFSHLHIPFTLPTKLSLWQLLTCTPPFIAVLLLAALLSKKLSIWSNPLCAISVIFIVGILLRVYEFYYPEVDFDATCSYFSKEELPWIERDLLGK